MPADEDRYFDNKFDIVPLLDYHYELIQSLERINTYNPPVHTCSTGWSFNGFYCGPTSVAFLFYKLSLVYPGLEFRQQSLREWAEDYLKLSQFARHEVPDPNHCGIANETLAFYALTSIMYDDQSLISKICSYESQINSDVGSNEWLYGRAGYLYILRLCRTHFETRPNTQKLVTLLNTIMKRTIEYVLGISRPWIWHETEYLGAVHGYIGIITQVLLSSPEELVVKTAQKLEGLLNDVLDMQMESGNFVPSVESLEDAKDDRLVQLCHGSPGFVLSLRSISRYFSSKIQPKIERAIQRAEDNVWNRGLLTKAPCVCHGIAGNALSFPKDDEHDRFEIFLAHITTEELEKTSLVSFWPGRKKPWLHDAGRTDDFVGLYTGEAGRAWLWAIADKKLERTCLGYNDV